MSAVNVLAGQTIKLDLLVTDGGPSLFPRAVLLDGNNLPLTESPIDLLSITGDLYSATFVMPETLKVTAVSTVYSDAGHTTRDNNYDQSVDEFVALAGSSSDLIDRVTELVTISRGVLSNAANSAEVELEDNNIDVEIDNSEIG